MELDCQRCDEGLVEFLYGELDDGQSAAFEHHLRSCPKCAATAEHLRQTRDLFSHLEEAEPPPFAALDHVFAEAQAKAAQMVIRANGNEPSTPSFWETLLETIRGAAFRPALGAAFTILLVAGIGILIWSDRPQHSPIVSPAQEALSPIPTSELSTRSQDQVQPQPREEIVQTRPSPEPQVFNDDSTKALSQRPPRPAKTPEPRDNRLKRSLEEPTERRSSETPSSKTAARQSGNSSWSREDDNLNRSAPSSPLVVEAERVPEGVQPAPTQGPQRPSTTAPPSIPVIPTPPLPQAVSAAQRQQFSEQGQQSPTPATGSTGGATPPAQQPVRVSTPGGQAQYDRGMQAYRTGRYRDAADELDAFVRSPSAPNHLVPTGMHHLAMSQQQAGNLSAAARSYEQLLQRFPSYNRRPQAMLEMARGYGRLGSFDRAERLLSQLAAIPGWSSRAQTELTRIQHLRAGQSGQMGPAHADEAASEVEAAESVE